MFLIRHILRWKAGRDRTGIRKRKKGRLISQGEKTDETEIYKRDFPAPDGDVHFFGVAFCFGAEGRGGLCGNFLTRAISRAVNSKRPRTRYRIGFGSGILVLSHALLPDRWWDALMRQVEEEMISAAKDLEFERAAKLRDRLLELRGEAPMKEDLQQRRHRRRERTRKSEH